MRACLWTVSDSFASEGNTGAQADHITRDEDADGDIISLADRRLLYLPNHNATHQEDFSGTQTSHVTALPVFHRDKVYNRKNLSGERARFLRLLLYPNHAFG
ncbi:hypothetical protein ACFQZS_12935 [Mucilaginibacter calamicampi]|uniref:HNH nuclease domain-containing protein n=2 Tax=Mucilaginibacter calamicampi TaxID=1302352 RepID=A0ABW2Z0R6_9SPHI